MKYVAIYRRNNNNNNAYAPVTILKDAKIRQVASAYELGLTKNRNNSDTFIEIERIDYGYDYYSAFAYRALEVEK